MAFDPATAELILQTRKYVNVNHEYGIGFCGDTDDEGSGDGDEGSYRVVNGFTVLLSAAMDKNSRVVQMLLRKFRGSLQVDAKNGCGNTALHLAAQSGSTEILGMLLEDGRIDVNVFNDEGLAALHLAAGSGHLDASRALPRHGADILAKLRDDEHGVTAE